MARGAVQVFARSGGTLYDLNHLDGLVLLNYSGLGMANVRRLTQRGPFQQGDTDLGFRVDPRTVGLTWGIWGRGERPLYDLEEARVKLYGIFRPRDDDPIQLLFITPAGQKRQMDVNLVGAVDGGSGSYEGYGEQRIGAAFKASDPRLYNPVQKSLTFDLLDTADGWNIEEVGETTADGWGIEETGQTTADGWQIGVSLLNRTQTLAYATGSLAADVEYPVIRVNGPINAPVIDNLTTGEKLDFSGEGGLVLGMGEYVEIDLSYSTKSIVNQAGESVEQYLTEDSDLATWHLAYNTEKLADGSRSDGNNTIRVIGTGATLATNVQILWYERFIGID